MGMERRTSQKQFRVIGQSIFELLQLKGHVSGVL